MRLAEAGSNPSRARILITRPEPGALRTAERVKALGFEAVVMPLSRTVSLPISLGREHFDAVSVTSPNLFRHVSDDILAKLRDLPLYAVGIATAKAAREAGFVTVIEGGGDAVRLAETMAKALPSGARVLYLAGKVRQPIFEERVAAAGLTMSVLDAYDIEAITPSADSLDRLLVEAPFVAALLYSGVAAEKFVDTFGAMKPAYLQDTRFLCISKRVSGKLPIDWQEQALVADHPDEEGLFRLLSRF